MSRKQDKKPCQSSLNIYLCSFYVESLRFFLEISKNDNFCKKKRKFFTFTGLLLIEAEFV